jgi:endopeptidase La
MSYNFYNFRKRKGDEKEDNDKNKKKKEEEDNNDNESSEYDPNDNDDSSSEDNTLEDSSDEESNSINSDDLIDITDNCDDENITSHNLDLLNEDSLKRKLTKSILLEIKNELKEKEDININSYLYELEKKINDAEYRKNEEHKNNIISLSAIELSNSILRGLISEIRYECKFNKELNLVDYVDNKLEILQELDDLDEDNKKHNNLPSSRGNGSNIIFQLMIDPMKYLQNKRRNSFADYFDDEDGDDDEEYDEEEGEFNEPKDKLDKQFHNFLTNGVLTPKDEMKYFKNLDEEEKKKYLDTIEEIKNNQTVEKPKMLKIIESNTSFNNKSVILNKLQNFDSLPPFSGEYFKLKTWVDGINKIPFGNFKEPPVSLTSSRKEIKSYLKSVKKHMDDAVYGHENAKKQILQVIAQTISNPNEGGTIIAIQGPPGVGKTQLIQDGISKALGRPFEFIALGGATDSAYLEGFDYTYEGSRWGKITDCLMQAKCMNPVIFFDELDKVSDTPKGEEIINILMHLTDLTQNSHYNDKYFQGIDFDMSKAIFIFSFNEEWKINKILKDRMYIIRTDGFELNEKMKISKEYLLPKIIKSVGYENGKIEFPDEIIRFIIENYTFEGGVRKLKECMLEICKEINLRMLSGDKVLGQKVHFPITVNERMLREDIFGKRKIHKIEKIYDRPKIGLVNGLWANDMGVGGLIPIEAFSIPTTNKLELELTGQQGDVMKESMRCAKTVAWNIIPNNCKERLNKEWNDFGSTGIHIHCPDGATPKDGPSAGAAITTAIISLLLSEPVDNKIAMTGEINLKGEVTEIGGLSQKLTGAKKAGATHVLVPLQNKPDLDKIISGENNVLDKNFKVTCVSNIWEVLGYCFGKKLDIRKL